MRITCEIDVANRTLATFNVKKRKQSTRSQLSIGRRPGSQNKDSALYLLICSAIDKVGTKYLIKDNVAQVFTKFITEGKATIRLREPAQDICISKADVLQLRTFLSVFKQALEGKPISDTTLSSLAPASNKTFDKPKTSVVILKRKEYPILENFPSTCETLQVSNCAMKKIDGRILKLKHLRCLNLSGNTLQSLPEDVGVLTKLHDLNLSDNKLSQFPIAWCRSTLSESLTILDLSNNDISELSPAIALLKNLVSVKLNNNSLTKLPVTIGKLSKLKDLSAAHNSITVLPGNVLSLRLENLDVFGNDFPSTQTPQDHVEMELGIPTLVELSARFIKKNSVPYNDELIFTHLCSYLDSARTCWCGAPCFHCSTRRIRYVDLHTLNLKSVTALDQNGTTVLPFEVFLCSTNCIRKFTKNPQAYWR